MVRLRARVRQGAGFVRDVWEVSRQHRVTAEAARIAYFFFLSLFPFLLILLSLTGLVGGEAVFDWVMGEMASVLPGEAYGTVESFVRGVTGSARPDVLSVGLLVTFFLASNIFAALFDGLNAAYQVRRRRRWWRKRAMAGLFLMLTLAVMLGSAVFLLAGPAIDRLLGLEGLSRGLRPALYLVAAGMLWLIYYFLPNRDQSRSKGYLLAGALAGTALWAVITSGYRLYVAYMGRYLTAYGVVWGVMLLLIWLYMTALSVLLGGEVAALLEGAGRRGDPGAARTGVRRGG